MVAKIQTAAMATSVLTNGNATLRCRLSNRPCACWPTSSRPVCGLGAKEMLSPSIVKVRYVDVSGAESRCHGAGFTVVRLSQRHSNDRVAVRAIARAMYMAEPEGVDDEEGDDEDDVILVWIVSVHVAQY